MKNNRTLLAAAGLALAALAPAANAQTAFTYQGVLEESGSPVTGLENIRFRVFDAPTGGALIGETTQNVDVTDGVFSAELNFGPLNTIDPNSAWLEIAINTGPGTFATLGRQRLTATPFAANTRGLNVDGSGRVSIGTTSHQDILHITGANARILTESTSGFFSGIRSRVAGREYFTGVDTFPGAAGAGWHVFDNTGGGRRLALIPNGNFGIGVSQPGERLHVNGGGIFDGILNVNTPNGAEFNVFNFDGGNGAQLVGGWETPAGFGPQVRYLQTGSPDFVDIGTNSANSFVVETNDTPRMTIRQDGSIGVGNSAGFGNVTFNIEHIPGDTGTLNVTDGAQSFFGVGPGGISMNRRVGVNQQFSNVSFNIRALSGDNVAFNVDNSAGAGVIQAQTNGDVFVPNLIESSDARLKHDIAELDGALEKVAALRGVSFTWNDDQPGAGNQHIGFLAQEVEQVVPEVVKTKDDGYKAVNYGNLTALLVEAMQDQQAQIEALEARIAEFEKAQTKASR